MPNEKKEEQFDDIPSMPIDAKSFMEEARKINKMMYPKESQFREYQKNEKSKCIYTLTPDTPLWDAIHDNFEAQKQMSEALQKVRLEALELQRERIIEDFSKLESFKAEDKFGNSVEIIRKDQAIEIIKKL